MRLGALACALSAALALHANGQDLLRVCDLDGDALDDVVMSTSVPGHELFALSAASGRVLWKSDATSWRRGTLAVPASPSLARTGDLDRDGRADFAVAWICAESKSGRDGSTVAGHSARDGRTLVTRTFADRTESAACCELASPGDTDGDGVRDLSLARWIADGTGLRVEVLCGRTLRTLASPSVGDPAWSARAVLRGYADFDSDGCVELSTSAAGWIVVGHAADDHVHNGSSRTAPLLASLAYEADDRAALVVRDPRTGLVERRGTIDGYDVWNFEDWRLEPFVDFDGDGREDFLLATPGRGRWTRSWCDDRGVGGVSVLSADGCVLREFAGDVALGRLGTAVAAAGDVDRDGLEDVWAVQMRQIATPELILYSGASGACIRRHLATTW